MEDPLIVRRGETGAELARNLHRLVLRQSADAPQERREILAVDVFHREEVVAVDVAHVVHAADVRVRDLPRDFHLGHEPRNFSATACPSLTSSAR